VLNRFGITLNDLPELVGNIINHEAFVPFVIHLNAAQPSLLAVGQQYVI
jgi:hypothetical protein